MFPDFAQIVYCTKATASSIIRRMEGYANTGLNYIQDKFDNAKEEFRSPYVFINLLREIVESKQQTDLFLRSLPFLFFFLITKS